MNLDSLSKLLKVAILGVLLAVEVFVVYKWYDKAYGKPEIVSTHYKLMIDEPITVKMSQKIMAGISLLLREKKIDSLLLVLDTPGGSPTASDNLYYYFKSLQKKIDVQYYINSAAVSGGYYIASGAERIYANQNAIVGSIGVIMQSVNVHKLANDLGIEDETLTAGAYKQMISPLKPTDEETVKYLQRNILEPVYSNFSKIVSQERNLTKEEQAVFFEGRVFIAGDERVFGKLIDEVISYPMMLENFKKTNNTDIVKILKYKEKYSDFLSEFKVSVLGMFTDQFNIVLK